MILIIQSWILNITWPSLSTIRIDFEFFFTVSFEDENFSDFGKFSFSLFPQRVFFFWFISGSFHISHIIYNRIYSTGSHTDIQPFEIQLVNYYNWNSLCQIGLFFFVRFQFRFQFLCVCKFFLIQTCSISHFFRTPYNIWLVVYFCGSFICYFFWIGESLLDFFLYFFFYNVQCLQSGCSKPININCTNKWKCPENVRCTSEIECLSYMYLFLTCSHRYLRMEKRM